MTELPQPVTNADVYLYAIAVELRAIRGRLDMMAGVQVETGEVALREPQPRPEPKRKPTRRK